MSKNIKKYVKCDFGQEEGLSPFEKIGGKEEPYIASRELIQAVNLAIFLDRPLLLQGEPGTGKTRFARAVARELYNEDGIEDHYREWHIKSISKAKEGLYSYDHIRRLRDAHGNREIQDEVISAKDKDKLEEVNDYVRLAPLGEALSRKSDKPMVLLIDEIDKADIDFPNDLLLELDQKYFYIPELQEKGPKGKKKPLKMESVNAISPIVIITSNNEKKLPDAFLRRCLFHYIQFPGDSQLYEIVKHHFEQQEEQEINPEELEAAIQTFRHIREVMKGDSQAEKRPGTSELLDWYRAIHHAGGSGSMLNKIKEIPFEGVLLKSWVDHEKFLAKIRKELQKQSAEESIDE